RAPEAATLALRGAQSAEAAGELADAQKLLEHAIDLMPTHILPHLALAAVMEKQTKWEGACDALESASKAAASTKEQAATLYRAATIAMDHLNDPARA